MNGAGQESVLAAGPGLVVSRTPVPSRRQRITRAISILTTPAIAVAVTLILAWQLRTEPFTLLDDWLTPGAASGLRASAWLNWGHAAVPLVFFIANLVNRRYGEDYARAHVLASWSLSSVIALAIMGGLITLSPPVGDVPAVRVMTAFVAGMILGQLAGVRVFDRTRGVAWWNAPAYGALVSTWVALPLFHVLAFAGTAGEWPFRLAVELGLKSLMCFVLLVPYFLLRPVVRPLQGLGGF